MARNIQLIIPMSGVGKRFVDAGYQDLKPLIDVDGYPMIRHVIDLFPGTTDVTFICNQLHLQQTGLRAILEELAPGCRIFAVPNENRRGPVDAVARIFEHLDDAKETIVSYCDYGSHWDYVGFLSDVRARQADGAIACYTGFHPHMLGTDNYAFVKEEGGRVVAVQEKQPFTDDRMSELASNGTYYFRSGAILKKYFQQLIDSGVAINNEFYVSVVYNQMIRDGLAVTSFLIEHMLQWGTPYDLEIYKGWSRYFSNIVVQQPSLDLADVTTVLPMAGRGSRFTAKAYPVPKPFLDINGAPMFLQAVNCLPPTADHVFICLADHLDEFNIEQELAKTYPQSKAVAISATTDGQACSCEIGIEQTGLDGERPILISACDNGVYFDTKKYQDLVSDESVDVIVWSFRNNQTSKVNPHMYSWLDVSEDGSIKAVSCKKFIFDDPLKTHAIIGTMFFRKASFFMEGLQRNYALNYTTNGEYYVDDVISRNIEMGLNVKVFEVENYVCWGTPDDYETYQYWRAFFDKCSWHPYSIEADTTYRK